MLLNFSYFHKFRPKKDELIARFFLFPNLDQNRNELIAEFLAIFTNLRTEGNKPHAQCFAFFLDLKLFLTV